MKFCIFDNYSSIAPENWGREIIGKRIGSAGVIGLAWRVSRDFWKYKISTFDWHTGKQCLPIENVFVEDIHTSPMEHICKISGDNPVIKVSFPSQHLRGHKKCVRQKIPAPASLLSAESIEPPRLAVNLHYVLEVRSLILVSILVKYGKGIS